MIEDTSEPEGDSDGPSLYFAFPDGVFGYVCSECTAICCRGHGFAGSLRREMVPLVARYPAIESSVIGRWGDWLTFATPPGGCGFLDSDNLCRIEKVDGREMKPGGCLLFPFNGFSRIGDVFVVSPNFLCPLRVNVPARPGQVEGTHSQIEAVLRESEILDSGFLASRVPVAFLHASEKPVGVLAREAAFRDSCLKALGQDTFAATLRGHSTDPRALDDFVQRAVGLLGLSESVRRNGRDEMDNLLLAFAAPLRLSMLRLTSEAILRALALGEVLLRRVLSISKQPATVQPLI